LPLLFRVVQKSNEYQTVLEEFPAYGSVLLRLANQNVTSVIDVNLRTVIVTAAVHRGFDQELRPRTNPIN